MELHRTRWSTSLRMALRVCQAVLDVSHPHQNAMKMPIRYADFLPFSAILLPFKRNAGLIENMSLPQKTMKKRPQRDSVLVGDLRTERSERVGGSPWPALDRRSHLGGRIFHMETNPSCTAMAELQGLSLPHEEQQSRRRSLLSALPVIGQR